MHRLFVALCPPEPVCDLLVDTMEGLDGVRWQDAEALHVTLRFVGEVKRSQGEDLAHALAQIRAAPFALQIDGVGHFARSKAGGQHPHALWAALAPSAPLEGLRRQVDRAAVAAGLPPDARRFVPHITIARLNSGSGPVGGWLSQHGLLRSEPWLVESFALIESHLSAHGSHYETIADYPLR
jgi:2'-5' RNA ligase